MLAHLVPSGEGARRWHRPCKDSIRRKEEKPDERRHCPARPERAGFALRSLSWLALGACGVMLAALSSATPHVQGFSALPGIAIVVACLTMNQIAYVAGVLAGQSRPMQPTKADAKSSWFA